MDKLDPADPRPPYKQLAHALRAEIYAGSYLPGDKLPSTAATAQAYGLSVGTVRRALDELDSSGLIVTRQGQGSYVRTDANTSPAPDEQPTSPPVELRHEVAALTARVAALERVVGMS